MDIGRLRHRCIIQKPTYATSNSGAVTSSWSTFSTVWGSVSPMVGRERWEALQVQPDITHNVTIRALKGVNPEKRILAPKETTTLGAAITTTDGTSITVAADFGISASTQFRILVDSELMIVTAVHGTTTYTVTRGADGTTAATHSNAALVTLMGVLEIQSVANVDERHEIMRISCRESV